MIASTTVEVIVVYCQGPGADRGRCRTPGPVIQKGAAWAWPCPACGHMNGSNPSQLGELPTPLEVLARR